jgi:hypothetical protein
MYSGSTAVVAVSVSVSVTFVDVVTEMVPVAATLG